MKKLITLFLAVALTVAVSCSNEKLDPNLSQSQSSGADLITTNGGNGSTGGNGSGGGVSTNPGDIAAFINKYAGVYYTPDVVKVYYKLREGKIWGAVDDFNGASDLLEVPAQAVMPSAQKLQISNYAKGTIEVLNFKDDGLDSYVNFILEKVSDEAQSNGMKHIGIAGKLISYAGTYKSVYDKIDQFVAIDREGNVYFHETVDKGKLFQSVDGKQLMIIDKDGVRNTMIFEQGVYRKFSLNTIEDVDTTAIVCEVTKDFIEDIGGGNAEYSEYYGTYVNGNGHTIETTFIFNRPIGTGKPKVTMTGSVSYDGWWKNGKNYHYIGDITILKGKELIIGKDTSKWDLTGQISKGTFSDDWSTLTYTYGSETRVHKRIK